MKLGVYSGECFHGVVGTPTGLVDFKGDEMYVGDIVLLYHNDHPNTELHHSSADHLTCVVDGRYNTYSDGHIQQVDGTFFVMGIKNVCDHCELNGEKWSVTVIKSHKDVVCGEHWDAFGFNYRSINENDKIQQRNENQ